MGKLRVRIVTLISRNYGNRLQNLALSQVLEELGCDVKTIPVEKNYKVRIMMKLPIKALLGKINQWELFETYIKYDKDIAENLNVDNIDYFIAGSDQIWNPYFKVTSKREYLYFAKPKQRISYAASIGIQEYSAELMDKYRDELGKFSSISVREDTAIDIVKTMCGKEDLLVLDPVMLLDRKRWDEILRKHHTKEKTRPYIAVYFLGELDNPCAIEVIDYAKRRGYSVMNILQESRKRPGSIGPLDFVNIIRNSEMVLTDSFHATVFSIIYHKKFIVVNRNFEASSGDMSARITSLLKMVKMEKRFVHKVEELQEVISECSFIGVDEIIENEREISMDFLRKAMDIN